MHHKKYNVKDCVAKRTVCPKIKNTYYPSYLQSYLSIYIAYVWITVWEMDLFHSSHFGKKQMVTQVLVDSF